MRLIAGISHIFTPRAQTNREISQDEAEAEVETEGGTAVEVDGERRGVQEGAKPELIARTTVAFSQVSRRGRFLSLFWSFAEQPVINNEMQPSSPTAVQLDCKRVSTVASTGSELGFNSGCNRVFNEEFTAVQLQFQLGLSSLSTALGFLGYNFFACCA